MAVKRVTEIYTVEIETDPETGHVLLECWKSAQGKLHRVDRDQPALRAFNVATGIETSTAWYRHGQRHRERDLPARIDRNPNTGRVIQQSWALNNLAHRDGDQPAHIRYDAQTGKVIAEEYFQHGMRHRDDHQPATIDYDVQTGRIVRSSIYVHDEHIPKRSIQKTGSLSSLKKSCG